MKASRIPSLNFAEMQRKAQAAKMARTPEIVASQRTMDTAPTVASLPTVVFNCSKPGITVHTTCCGKIAFVPTTNGRSRYSTQNPNLVAELKYLADRSGQITYLEVAPNAS